MRNFILLKRGIMYLTWTRIKAAWQVLTSEYYAVITSKDGKAINLKCSVTCKSFAIMADIAKSTYENKAGQDSVMDKVNEILTA